MGIGPTREKKNLASAAPGSAGADILQADVSGRTITGYFATWDLDRVGDYIDRKAFDKTFKERGPRHLGGEFLSSRIKIDFNHEEIVGVPIRLWADSKGAGYEARIDASYRGDLILARVVNKSLDMNSFVYDVIDSEPISNGATKVIDGGYTMKERRRLKELRVHFVGPVDSACNEGAIIHGLLDPRKTSGKQASDAEVRAAMEILSTSVANFASIPKSVPTLAERLLKAAAHAR